METIFVNTGNSGANKPHRFRLSLVDKPNLKYPIKNIALVNLSIYYTWKNIKSAYNKNKCKISAPTWSDEFDLPDGSYSIVEIQNYFGFFIKKHKTLAEDTPEQIYPNKIKNKILFKVKTGYKLELLSPETMKLFGSTDAHQDKDEEDVLKLEFGEVVLVHCNLVNNKYQQVSKVLFTFVPSKRFGELINIAPHSLVMLGATNKEFSSIEMWLTDQNSEALEIEDSVNLTLITG